MLFLLIIKITLSFDVFIILKFYIYKQNKILRIYALCLKNKQNFKFS